MNPLTNWFPANYFSNNWPRERPKKYGKVEEIKNQFAIFLCFFSSVSQTTSTWSPQTWKSASCPSQWNRLSPQGHQELSYPSSPEADSSSTSHSTSSFFPYWSKTLAPNEDLYAQWTWLDTTDYYGGLRLFGQAGGTQVDSVLPIVPSPGLSLLHFSSQQHVAWVLSLISESLLSPPPESLSCSRIPLSCLNFPSHPKLSGPATSTWWGLNKFW